MLRIIYLYGIIEIHIDGIFLTFCFCLCASHVILSATLNVCYKINNMSNIWKFKLHAQFEYFYI